MERWKKVLLVVIIILVIIAVFGISGWLYFKYKQQQETQIVPVSAEQKIKDQLKQLDVLSQQYNLKPLTQQQISQQLQQLDKLSQNATTSTTKTTMPKLTQQQIQQQLDALQKLKGK